MMKMMADGEKAQLSLLFLFFPAPEGSILWLMGTFCLSPYLCCHDLCDASTHAGCHSLCSIYCTSLCSSPTVGNYLFPSVHGLQGLDPSFHRGLALEEVAFVHQGCGLGRHLESETVT